MTNDGLCRDRQFYQTESSVDLQFLAPGRCETCRFKVPYAKTSTTFHMSRNTWKTMKT